MQHTRKKGHSDI